MALVLALGGGLGHLVHRARVQREAVAAIDAAEGTWEYDWQVEPDGFPFPSGEPPAPRWLVDALGPDHFGGVATVTLGGSATDATMAHVGRLPRLVSFMANWSDSPSRITDTGLAHLAGLAALTSVDLSKTAATGAALRHLDRAAGLYNLSARGLAVRDADLPCLAAHPGLLYLDLSDTAVTDAGLAALPSMPGLVRFCLDGTAVTDAGLRLLPGKFPGLASLHLARTRVTDAGLDAFRRAQPGVALSR